MAIERLVVSIELGGIESEVGELVQQGKNIYFKYYPDFIKTGIEISPFKLALSDSILTPGVSFFDGLFGVFDDSLPDGWGRLLFDRMMTSKGIPVNAITPLDRLSYLGQEGKGALIYRPKSGEYAYDDLPLNLDLINQANQEILAGASSEIIDQLFAIAGSSGGARPKIYVAYNPKEDHIIPATDPLPIGYEHWIIKFSSSVDPEDIAQTEFAYHKMALDAGINMETCKLFRGASGKYFFGTRRFDRKNNQRQHLHSASGMLHDNFRLSNMDYGHLMDCAFRLERHVNAYEKILRLAAFNIYAHNRDDHSKNFSFLMNATGDWSLAPAYDLTYSRTMHGHHSLTVAGEGKNPGRKQLLELAETFGVQHAEKIIDQVRDIIANWKGYADAYEVSKATTRMIQQTFNQIGK